MSNIIKMPNTDQEVNENSLIEVADGLLVEARDNAIEEEALSVPIGELASLGAGVASLIPAFRTVTHTTITNTDGLYRLTNQGIGDVLKIARNGNFWPSFKTAQGSSKLAQLQEVKSLATTTTSIANINPAIVMMAVALFCIEQKLDEIKTVQKQILAFLEIEKEAEIEADLETLSNMLVNYKLNWDNDYFVASNHKMVLDIKRTARKNVNAYLKKVNQVLKSSQFLVLQNTVNDTQKDLLKKFKYYRLSLYIFSMASMIEIMLSGNFKEEYITGIKDDIKKFSDSYVKLFKECSAYLKKLSKDSVETNVLKGIGSATESIGHFIGSIPFIKDGQVDEALKDGAKQLKSQAEKIEEKTQSTFSKMSSPQTNVFIDSMEKMIRIYNHTENIYFDDKKIYLVAK